jgi:hypothetical protein
VTDCLFKNSGFTRSRRTYHIKAQHFPSFKKPAVHPGDQVIARKNVDVKVNNLLLRVVMDMPVSLIMGMIM